MLWNKTAAIIWALALSAAPLRAQVDTWQDPSSEEAAPRAAETPKTPDLCEKDWPEVSRKLIRYVHDCRQPLDWSDILAGPERVIYIGDQHMTRGIRNELVRRLPDMKAAGVVYFGTEFPRFYQPWFDRLCKGEAPDPKMVEDMDKTVRLSREELSLFQKVCESGIKLLALDSADDLATAQRKHAAWEETGCRGEGCKRGRDACIAGRDCTMAEQLFQRLNIEKSARAVVFTGYHHASYAFQPAHLEDMSRGQIRTRSYRFIVVDTQDSEKPDYTRMDLDIFQAMREHPLLKDIAHQELLIPLPKESMPRYEQMDGLLWIQGLAYEYEGRRKGIDSGRVGNGTPRHGPMDQRD